MFDDPKFLAKLDGIVKRQSELSDLLGRPEVIGNRAEFLKLTKENALVSELADQIVRRAKLVEELDGARALSREGDAEMREMAKEELPRLEAERRRGGDHDDDRIRAARERDEPVEDDAVANLVLGPADDHDRSVGQLATAASGWHVGREDTERRETAGATRSSRSGCGNRRAL